MLCCTHAGLLCDLLWSDPDKDVVGWGENDRGVSWTFGADEVNKFLKEAASSVRNAEMLESTVFAFGSLVQILTIHSC